MKNFFEDKITLNLSGSIQTDLFMPWSDLNIITNFKEKKFFSYEKIKNFVNFLKKKKYITKINYEERTRLVILKIEFEFENSNLRKKNKKKVEIIFKQNNLNYPNNEEIIKIYLKNFPVLKPLYLIFRKMLKRQFLDDPINGLKNLVIILLIVAFLQKMEFLNKKPCEGLNEELSTDLKIKRGFLFENMEIGELFANFLFYYSYTFNYKEEFIFTEITDKIKNPIYSKNQIKLQNKNNLCVVNPYNKDIILTKSFKKIKQLKLFFKLSYVELFNTCICAKNRFSKIFFKIDKKKKNFFSEKNFLKIDYKIFKKVRESKKSIVVEKEKIGKEKLRRNSEFIPFYKKNEVILKKFFFVEKNEKNFENAKNGGNEGGGEDYDVPSFIIPKIFNFYLVSK